MSRAKKNKAKADIYRSMYGGKRYAYKNINGTVRRSVLSSMTYTGVWMDEAKPGEDSTGSMLACAPNIIHAMVEGIHRNMSIGVSKGTHRWNNSPWDDIPRDRYFAKDKMTNAEYREYLHGMFEHFLPAEEDRYVAELKEFETSMDKIVNTRYYPNPELLNIVKGVTK